MKPVTPASTGLRSAFAPTGTLRFSINHGNPILAHRDRGSSRGVSVDIANELGARLGLPVELHPYDAAGKAVDGLVRGDVDIGFFAIDPKRSREVRFTDPYLVTEGAYLVRSGSPIEENADVDRPGMTVVVGAGSAYDLFLTRELKEARILRAPTSPVVVDTFLDLEADAAAGIRQQLIVYQARVPGLRLLPDRFMLIRQAIGMRIDRDPAMAACLNAFVQDMKSSGFLATALSRHCIEGATVAH